MVMLFHFQIHNNDWELRFTVGEAVKLSQESGNPVGIRTAIIVKYILNENSMGKGSIFSASCCAS
jgi:hypothetical protein